NPNNPTADNGGWNEMIASIADSQGNWTSVRSRFVQLPPPTVQDLALTPLRSFDHLQQDDCAAFGPFQCGGVMLTQAIPGFVTRDRDRGLHLVYRSASQRAPTILPYQLNVSAFQIPPDSIRITAFENGAVVSETLRYMGLVRPTGASPDDPSLNPRTTEVRVVGAELRAPATGDAAIRSIQVAIQGFYPNGVNRTNSVSQEVTQLYRTDTTSARFGQGWALAEQSRLILGQKSRGVTAII